MDRCAKLLEELRTRLLRVDNLMANVFVSFRVLVLEDQLF